MQISFWKVLFERNEYIFYKYSNTENNPSSSVGISRMRKILHLVGHPGGEATQGAVSFFQNLYALQMLVAVHRTSL